MHCCLVQIWSSQEVPWSFREAVGMPSLCNFLLFRYALFLLLVFFHCPSRGLGWRTAAKSENGCCIPVGGTTEGSFSVFLFVPPVHSDTVVKTSSNLADINVPACKQYFVDHTNCASTCWLFVFF